MGIVHAKAADYKHGIPRHKINYNTCETAEDEKEIHLDDIKARVDRVHIEGVARTKDDIIQDAVQDLFTATDFEEVLFKAHQVRQRLDSLGCFRNIAVFIDTSKGSNATPEGLEVTYHVKEFKAITGGVNTQIGNNEGSLIIGLKAPNFFGRGERLQAEFSYGSKKTNNYHLSFIKPFRGKRSPVLTTTVYQNNAEFLPSGYRDKNLGLLLDYGFNSFSFMRHNLQYDAAIRDISVLSRSSAFDIRERSGMSLKSAVRHILSIDQRDEPIFPTCGSLTRFTTELAGLGGNVGYLKNDLFLQSNYSLFKGLVLQSSFASGVLYPLSEGMEIGLSDLFYVGGPLSVRGFQMRGLGPGSENNAIGSKAYWAGAVHIFAPLPFSPGKGGIGDLFRTHFFVNAGNVADVSDSPLDVLDQLSHNFRVAFGLGIAIRLGQMARVEINYCFPFITDGADRVQQGVQFGVGVEFL